MNSTWVTGLILRYLTLISYCGRIFSTTSSVFEMSQSYWCIASRRFQNSRNAVAKTISTQRSSDIRQWQGPPGDLLLFSVTCCLLALLIEFDSMHIMSLVLFLYITTYRLLHCHISHMCLYISYKFPHALAPSYWHNIHRFSTCNFMLVHVK